MAYKEHKDFKRKPIRRDVTPEGAEGTVIGRNVVRELLRSGRDVDKFKELGLHISPASEVSAPLLDESPVNIECRVTQVLRLGTHDMFVAKVVSVHADEKYMDENGKFSLEKADPIAYSHGTYYTLGEKLGTFGYSVKKR